MYSQGRKATSSRAPTPHHASNSSVFSLSEARAESLRQAPSDFAVPSQPPPPPPIVNPEYRYKQACFSAVNAIFSDDFLRAVLETMSQNSVAPEPASVPNVDVEPAIVEAANPCACSANSLKVNFSKMS